jgi:hypothetical protein
MSVPPAARTSYEYHKYIWNNLNINFNVERRREQRVLMSSKIVCGFGLLQKAKSTISTNLLYVY